MASVHHSDASYKLPHPRPMFRYERLDAPFFAVLKVISWNTSGSSSDCIGWYMKIKNRDEGTLLAGTCSPGKLLPPFSGLLWRGGHRAVGAALHTCTASMLSGKASKQEAVPFCFILYSAVSSSSKTLT